MAAWAWTLVRQPVGVRRRDPCRRPASGRLRRSAPRLRSRSGRPRTACAPGRLPASGTRRIRTCSRPSAGENRHAIIPVAHTRVFARIRRSPVQAMGPHGPCCAGYRRRDASVCANAPIRSNRGCHAHRRLRRAHPQRTQPGVSACRTDTQAMRRTPAGAACSICRPG